MQPHHSQGREVALSSNTYLVQPFLREGSSNNYYCNQNMSPNYSVMSGFQYGESSSELPPTPPSNTHDYNDNLNSPSQSLLEKGSASPATLRLPIRTIGYQRSPPTPDTTPPRGLDFYGRSPSSSKQLNYASSRAESFTTAREQPFSSQVDIGTPFSEPKGTLGVDLVELEDDVDNTTIDSASGSEDWSNEVANTSVTGKIAFDQERIGSKTSSMSETENRPRAPGNVKAFLRLETSPLMQSIDFPNESQKTMATHSMSHKDINEVDRSPDSIKKFEQRLLDDDLGRISATSTSSSVVQAVVLDASPRQRRSLRHAGRNLAYRFSDSISPDSPTLHESSLKPIRVHQLTHKNQKIPKGGLHLFEDKAVQQKTGLTVVSDTQPERNAPNLYSMRYSAPKDNHVESCMVARTGQIPLTSDRRMRHTSAPERNSDNFYSGSLGLIGSPITIRTYGEQNNFRIPRKRVNSSVRSPKESIMNSESDTGVDVQGHTLDSCQGNDYKAASALNCTNDLRQKLPSERSANTTQEISILQDITARKRPEASTLNILTPLRNSQASGSSSEKQQIEEATRTGLIRSGSGAYKLEPRRRSSDRFSSRTEEHAMARHLYLQETPLSHITDSQDALEVSEATAVSIFPHNNNSLLVVQQMTRPVPNARRELISTLPSKSTQPEINLLPATPTDNAPQGLSIVPLENPRKPPEPPEFQVIPPTPCQEPDYDVNVQPNLDDFPAPPSRRMSLIKRARRYSDSLIQPILTQALSTRRVASQQVSEGVSTANENQKNTLHPFWRPRGFWDEFDSESDPGDIENGRLPPGGDNSNMMANVKPKRRLTFRGTGGFLIGNTLGVTRAGTNVRRHHISLPARLAAQRQSREAALDGNGHNNSLYSVTGKSSSSEIALMRHAGKVYKIPGLGVDFRYVGLSDLRTIMVARRRKREMRKMEERRERLRQNIGPRVSVN